MAKNEPDTELIRRLAAILTETDLTEIEYANQAVRVRVARSPAMMAAVPTALPSASIIGATAVGNSAPVANSTASNRDRREKITSPMVGTVFLSAEPGAPPFVNPGDEVTAGQTLLIIEAMKVMNPLPAPRAGRIAEIVATDVSPVEFGETLLIYAD